MTANIQFDLVAPDASLLSEEVEMVVLPGQDGDFGVMKGHAPFLSSLRPGLIIIFENEKPKKSFFVSGGFVDVNDGNCTVLSDSAIDVANINADDLSVKISNLREDIQDAKTASEKAKLETLLTVELEKQSLLGQSPY